MKILLVQPQTYVPPQGGASKANQALAEGLAARGHECRVVARATAHFEPQDKARLLAALAEREIKVSSLSSTSVVFHHNGVEVHAAVDSSHLRAELLNQIHDFEPTWTLVSADDATYILLAAALRETPARVVFVVHSPAPLPFGPACFTASQAKSKLIREVAGIITVSKYMQDYIQQWGGLESVTIPFPVYGSGPFPCFGRFDSGFVTMINPSAIKGISIFAELARHLPDVPFAAVPTWGTTDEDRHTLEQLPNVRLLKPADDIDEIFAQTRILLMPSLWAEAFPLTPVEAMLRGIPVLASDAGGLPEAKLGVDYVFPVQPITRYKDRLDQQNVPIPDVPEQNIDPWVVALRQLLSNRMHYDQISAASRRAALAFVSRVSVAPFADYLQRLMLPAC